MWNKIKEWLEWLVAILAVITGWYIIQKYLFGKTDEEKRILNNIKTNDENIEQKQQEVDDNLKQENELHNKVDNIQDNINDKYNEVNEYNKKADEEKQKIINESQEIQNNLDYINDKYK